MSQLAMLTEGDVINNRYRVINLIGGGAMARVYRVEHIELGTIHALKEQSGGDDVNPEPSLEAALREARFLSKLSHPGIPRVTDFFREGGHIYFVMDYIDGQNLKSIIDRNEGRSLDIPTVLRWGIQVCDVLIYLHSQNPPIIFRDIKPSNLIRRPDGTVNLVDFGIARRVRQGAASDTVLFGSPGYAPPEQYGQGQTTPRSDIYALGATLHHLLSGRDPSNEPFKWPSLYSLNPAVPLVLDRLIMKCLDMKPANRLESAEALRTGLRFSLQFIEEGTGASTVKKLIGMGSDTGDLTMQELQAPEKKPELVLPESASNVPALRPRPAPPHSSPPVYNQLANMPPPQPQPNGIISVHRYMTGTRSNVNQFLFMLLFVAAIPVLGFSVFYLPYATINLVLPPTAVVAPVQMPSESEAAFDQRRETYAEQEHSQRLIPMQVMLDVLVCVAFFFGVIRPMRATMIGLIMTAGGIIGLIILTGTLMLPARPTLFVAFAVIEALLLIPIVLLFTSEET